jgi:hypothetical protein
MSTDKRIQGVPLITRVADRDGLYVYVLKAGTISFRFNYAINGR